MCVYQHFIQIPSGTGGLYQPLVPYPGSLWYRPLRSRLPSLCLPGCVRTAVPIAFILKNEGVRGNWSTLTYLNRADFVQKISPVNNSLFKIRVLRFNLPVICCL